MMVMTCIQRDQLLDLLQRKACRLRRANKPEPTKIHVAITPYPLSPCRSTEQPFALVKADCFDPYFARCSKFANRQFHDLTPYCGTEFMIASMQYVNQMEVSI